MSATIQTMTAEELFTMADDGFRYDLVKGELRKVSPAGSEHVVEANDLGEVFGAETGFKLASNPDTVRAPDVAFVRNERIPQEGIPKAFWPGAPDLAVEVVSPGDSFDEVEEKINDYLTAGVCLIWIISPKRRTVTVHRPQTEAQTLTENDMLDGRDVVEGFRCSVARILNRRQDKK